ncbi:hypothetical protein F4813DRAFT_383084 [Daldinia decipiens]|uniref:uncharacterized protein n=1 Tax=Daldinia decipiens TaxID=326647 RepID=UPI0020C39A5C|nr:uncharacterized protein F4813DRAFT_383084 [Daldinia decipiens]KAI1653653.1 hypothetical protein F4813DRAFT_383084 [Daldinia decipiens]
MASTSKKQYKKRNTDRPSCIFSPLPAHEYERSLNPKELDQFNERVQRLDKRVWRNCNRRNVSEFCWEVHAWEDVFDQIREEDAFRMDKIDYTALEEDRNGNWQLTKRTPDATIGFQPTHGGFETEVQSAKGWVPLSQICEATRVPFDRDSDAKSFVFPFAIYEAKKSYSSDFEAETQIARACDRYLGLLDGVVRDPRDPTKYQWRTSREYQMFAFTSCASEWRVYAARRYGEYHNVETIWAGDVRFPIHAVSLLSIVDQIHKWAADVFRPFVIKHLDIRAKLSMDSTLRWNRQGFIGPEAAMPSCVMRTYRCREVYKCTKRLKFVQTDGEIVPPEVLSRVSRLYSGAVVVRELVHIN